MAGSFSDELVQDVVVGAAVGHRYLEVGDVDLIPHAVHVVAVPAKSAREGDVLVVLVVLKVQPHGLDLLRGE